ncbi:sensor histidine kinase [Prauserella muralis]|uniref:histidine kinase n=1 Tax=Prauserella muralis TaxID=588067 RepID=A0A2V4B7A7_9PSEU|nr:sensor histidine kinase [Prauserella muralis]PXY31130.1 two-component sensor histidine kinase [Prauserella muralis]TWE14580.1 signal transduction histidine kinase [Prauserella muralis]
MQHRIPLLRLPAWAQDVLLAAFVTVMQVQGTVVRNSGEPELVLRPLADLGYLGYVLLVVSGAVVAVRRRWPVAVFGVTALASVVYYVLDFPDGPGWLGLFVAIYTLTALGDGRRSLAAAGAGIAALATCWLIAAADIEPPAAIGWVFFRIGASVMSATLGESVRSRRFIAAEALERAELAERTRDEEARARVDEERLRIAREVHDTVAHAIAVINVQSGVTAHVLDKRPDPARETLEAIEQTSSQALREMRTILGVLRDDNEGRVPHPGLGQIDELTATAREAGLDLDLEAGSPPPSVPSAISSAVYRILQESITNVIRHVGPTRVTVALDYGADSVEVRVRDEGRRGGPGDDEAAPGLAGRDRPGRGILGMRERCRLLGGDLDAGPLPGGGFAVTARLPLAPSGTANA